MANSPSHTGRKSSYDDGRKIDLLNAGLPEELPRQCSEADPHQGSHADAENHTPRGREPVISIGLYFSRNDRLRWLWERNNSASAVSCGWCTKSWLDMKTFAPGRHLQPPWVLHF
jgi:hypothetical protein